MTENVEVALELGNEWVEAERVLKCLLGKVYIALKRLLVEIGKFKVILVRLTKVEMKNMLLETGGKVILIINWQRIGLNCVLVFSGRKNLEVIKSSI